MNQHTGQELPGETTVMQDFIDCYDELLSCIPVEAEVCEFETGEKIVDDYSASRHGDLVFDYLCPLAADLAVHDTEGFQPPDKPRYALTERVVQTQRECAISLAFEMTREACFQAELRAMRALDRHWKQEGRLTTGYLPAAILLDIDGQPFAYQKADGMPSALAWRNANYQTARGVQRVLGGMLLFLNYGQQAPMAAHHAQDPRIDLTTKDTPDLIILDPAKHQPRSVKLYRFLTSCLTPALRAAAVDEGIYLGLNRPRSARGPHMAPTDLSPYRTAAKNFSCNGFAADIHDLIAAHQPPIL